MAERLVKFTAQEGKVKYYINPAHVAYIRDNIGGVTYVAFGTGLDSEHGTMCFLLVDGSVDETARKLNLALD